MSLNFIVFSDDWGRHPSSCQHIFKRISKEHKVFWFNTIGMRLPKCTIYDLKRILEKIKSWFFPSDKKEKQKNLTIFNPFMLPFSNVSIVNKLNMWLLSKCIKKATQNLSDDPVFVTTVPNIVDVLNFISVKKKIYYRVDDFTKWPGLMHDTLRRFERDLLNRIDVLIASSKDLIPNNLTVKSFIVEHGVDYLHFKKTSDNRTVNKLNIYKKPVIGYFGLLDQRIDYALIKALAKSKPDCSIVLIGRKTVDLDLADLFENIYYLGAVDYAELPHYLKGIDICLLPYRCDESTKSISPLKLKECLASGKPVVATNIPAVRSYTDVICIVTDVSEIETCIDQVFNKGIYNFSSAQNSVMHETWERKAEEFVTIISG